MGNVESESIDPNITNNKNNVNIEMTPEDYKKYKDYLSKSSVNTKYKKQVVYKQKDLLINSDNKKDIISKQINEYHKFNNPLINKKYTPRLQTTISNKKEPLQSFNKKLESAHKLYYKQTNTPQNKPYIQQQNKPYIQQQNKPYIQQQNNSYTPQNNQYIQQNNSYTPQNTPYIQQQNNPYIQQQNPYTQQHNNPSQTSEQQSYQQVNKDLFSNLKLQDIDPFYISKKEPKITLIQLKQKYKQLAIMNHPDKGGDASNFDMLITVYKNIENLINYRKENKTHNELKNEYKTNTVVNKNYKNVELNRNLDSNFNLTKFNKIYSTYKLKETNYDGYGDIMDKSTKERDDIDIKKTLTQYTASSFNTKFNDKKKLHTSQQIVTYTPPKPMDTVKLNFSKLGEGKIEDFSDNQQYRYTDYKKAHINNFLIDPDVIKLKKYTNVEELKKDRKSNTKLSPKIWEAIEKNNEYNKTCEWERRNRLKEHDKEISNQYQKINKLMLNYHN